MDTYKGDPPVRDVIIVALKVLEDLKNQVTVQIQQQKLLTATVTYDIPTLQSVIIAIDDKIKMLKNC